jgi:hypothetical protein
MSFCRAAVYEKQPIKSMASRRFRLTSGAAMGLGVRAQAHRSGARQLSDGPADTVVGWPVGRRCPGAAFPIHARKPAHASDRRAHFCVCGMGKVALACGSRDLPAW